MSIKQPFNLDLIVANTEYVRIRKLKEVTSVNIMSTSDSGFDPNGLYSTEIFGPLGSEERMNTFAYIDLKVPIINPLIYKTLIDLKALYNEVMASSAYAKLEDNGEEIDLERSTIMEGSTGYEFFISILPKLKLSKRDSARREVALKVLEKYKGKYMVDKLLVLPAGYREYEMGKDGSPSDPEINSLYRRVIGVSKMVDTSQIKTNIESLDTIRATLQARVYDVYAYIIDFLNDKKGFIQGKFANRKVAYTSRNVITALSITKPKLKDKTTPGPHDTVLGIHQAAVNTLPILAHNITATVLSNVFIENTTDAYLIDKETLKRTPVKIKPKTYQKWMTRDGIAKIVDSLVQEELRSKPVVIEDKYLVLIYKHNDVFKLVFDIDQVPDNIDKGNIEPITYGELFYIVIASYIRKYHTFITRYPVLSEGGIYPSKIFLASTMPFKVMYKLDELWNKTEEVYPSFPIKGERYYNSTSPNPTHLAALGGDHDGDTTSAQTTLSEEANEELARMLKSKKYYVSTAGNINYSAAVDVAEYTLSYLIGE